MAAITLATGNPLLGQVSDSEVVVYRKCTADGLQFRREPACGIDEEATAAAQAKRKATEKLLQQIADRNKKLTPQTESLVEEAMEELFVTATMRKVESLRSIVSTAEARIEGLLTLQWPAQDTEALQQLESRFVAYAESLSNATFSRTDFRQLRDEVYRDTKNLQEIAARKPRDGASSKPIENIVTRIDSLVATVGTVLSEVEKEGIAIPSQVRGGYEQSKNAIRLAKESCSMRRPKACRQLWDVLISIESIREPLCALPSDRLAFCRS